MIKLNAQASLPYRREAAPQRRWWLGWLQLFCAWLLCMLLCANVALVLAQGLPKHEAAPVMARKAADCSLSVEAAKDAAGANAESVSHTLRRMSRCSAP
ncbi:hypothetical protein EH244_20560 [Variovorax beijingensis]|uniref:Uncharacterized protein n=1 Tax=Variovorax beijingensis TaxID=2496117 RepID=A0A3P3EJL8_9BURK|nr:hypothetical protein [Variovorax beijingensis]RRH86589.1 hypothetical protein EH244_20560 [Variovorax beijingensis]RSZ31714.1 hypothetical protein EJO66_23410 [Variovorax beijingensis]